MVAAQGGGPSSGSPSSAPEVIGSLAALVLGLGLAVAAVNPESRDSPSGGSEALVVASPESPAARTPFGSSTQDGGPTPAAPSAGPGAPGLVAPSPALPDGPLQPSVTAPLPEATATPDPGSGSTARVVVLSVDAPARVAAGEQVTFEVQVSGVGGRPVISTATFGDGVVGGAGTSCAGDPGPSFTGTLRITHTYARPGTYSPYFVATIPCGPSSGAGTTLTVGSPAPSATAPSASTPPTPASPTPASPTPSPTTSLEATPAPSGTPTGIARPAPPAGPTAPPATTLPAPTG